MIKKGKPSPKQGKPRVHKELSGFEVSIDQFGGLQSNMDIEKINSFLDRNVDDKKLLEKDKNKRLKKSQKENK
ncbi:MAG: hypothetical protein ORN54_10780 [Cyclobacteriaceae bacterium]|nr:hypothetical protein [Cyclobacteriaceae bacterium]